MRLGAGEKLLYGPQRVYFFSCFDHKRGIDFSLVMRDRSLIMGQEGWRKIRGGLEKKSQQGGVAS